MARPPYKEFLMAVAFDESRVGEVLLKDGWVKIKVNSFEYAVNRLFDGTEAVSWTDMKGVQVICRPEEVWAVRYLRRK